MRYDFLVVGAGIVGLATAYHLARRCHGCRVLVVDKRGGPGYGDTGRSAAAFRAFFYSRTNMALAASSIRFYRYVQEVEGFDLGMRFIGYLFLLSGKRYETVKPVLGELRRRGLGYRLYDAGELEEMLGLRAHVSGDEEARLMGLEDVAVGVLAEEAGVMRPEKLVEYYYREAEGLGVEFRFNTAVERLIVEPSEPLGVRGEPFPWQDAAVRGAVLAGGGEVRADVTVAAMGAEAPPVLEAAGVDPGARPKKRQVFVVRASTPELQRLLYARGFNDEGVMPFLLLPKGVYVRPVPEEKSFWVGASDHLGRPFRYEPDPSPEPWFYSYGLHPVLRQYLPAFSDASPEAGWAGHYDISIDGQPVVYSEPGLVVAGGTSGSGIMKADAVGRIAASLALGEETATLYGGERLPATVLSLRERRVEHERLVI